MAIIENMPAAEYHAHRAISKSGLDLIARSPAHFRYARQREETRAMLVGSATHAAILQPELYRATYHAIRDAKDRRCKEWNAGVKAAPVSEDFILTGPEVTGVETMADAVRSNPHMAKFLDAPGRAELSVFGKDPVTGLQVRIRIDWLTDKLVAMDLKTTRDLRNDQFVRSVFDYRYHVQAAFYRDVFKWATGEDLRDFVFGVIESDVPHVSVPVRLPADLLKCGEIEYRRDLNRYADCLETDSWPGPQPEPFVLQLPTWAEYKVEDVFDSALLEHGDKAA
jgi:exodeoxyribonuclease VIII